MWTSTLATDEPVDLWRHNLFSSPAQWAMRLFWPKNVNRQKFSKIATTKANLVPASRRVIDLTSGANFGARSKNFKIKLYSYFWTNLSQNLTEWGIFDNLKLIVKRNFQFWLNCSKNKDFSNFRHGSGGSEPWLWRHKSKSTADTLTSTYSFLFETPCLFGSYLGVKNIFSLSLPI